MKKTFLCFIATLLILISGISLVGCDMGTGTPAIPDYNADVQVVEPENIDVENFIAEEDTTYYTSPGFSLWMEVNGAFMEMDYFSLDGDKRVYDNLYFYVDDYFYIVTDDYKDLYASLGDSADLEYAEEEKEQGYDIQINVKKAGIYKLTFDVMQYKEWLNEWHECYVKPTTKSKTYIRYSEIVYGHIIPKIGSYDICELTPLILQRFVTDLLSGGNLRTGVGLSSNSDKRNHYRDTKFAEIGIYDRGCFRVQCR